MRDSSLGPLLAVFYGCGFLAGFNENLVNMALVAIMGDFSIDAVAAQWLVTGYMIAVTVVVTCMAYLYRRLSMRTLFFAAAALSIAGSAGGFLAPNFPLLLVARLVQAAGTGVFIPLMMNVIVDRVPHGRLGTYLAIGSAMITIGPATAPIVTGFMVSDWGWRSVFLVPLAAAVALTVAGIFVVRGGREPELVRFDLPSALLTAAGVTLLCVGLSEVTLRPAVGAAALIGAALALGWFARRQEHLARPLVSMGPLHHGMFWPAALLVMVTMMTYFSLSVMAPLYFEEAAGLAASAAGVLMVAPVLANAAASVLSGRALDRWGEWALAAGGARHRRRRFGDHHCRRSCGVGRRRHGGYLLWLSRHGHGALASPDGRVAPLARRAGFPRRDAHVHGRAVVGMFGAGGLYRHYELRHGSGRRSRCACRPG